MKNFFFIILIICIFSIKISAQEVIILGSGFNYQNQIYDQNINNSKSNDTLELPFFDDFSYNSPIPKSSLWLGNYVNISLTASKNPPSIGAAMFDALNNENTYYSTGYNTNQVADLLTSKPINLNYPGNNTIYLSFFFQAQGYLDAPEVNDSLILEFYSPQTTKWEKVWYALGTSVQDFQQIIININADKYLQKGFQFRFKNRVSMTSNPDLSMVSNCDFWFIDYVRLNMNRTPTDLNLPELALQYPLRFKIDDYDMMPYEHYKNAVTKHTFNHSYSIKYRNNDSKIRLIDSLYLIFKEKNNVISDTKLSLGTYNVPANQNIKTEAKNITFSFPILNNNSLDFNIETVIITNTLDSTFNNRNTINKPMTNYYAYDDGSPEVGYDLHGDGTLHAMVATKFYTYKTDTLTGLNMFINKTFKDEQPNYFYLMVWKNDPLTGKPGDVILEKEGVTIDKLHLNQFHNYLFDTAIIVTDTFYVGWRKASTKLLNIGLDLNSVDKQHKYYNMNGNWVLSSTAGDLLLRPYFGNEMSVNISVSKISEFKIYPNPANDFIKIENYDLDNYSNIDIKIYNILGTLIYSQKAENNYEINTSNLSDGIYLLQISNNKKIISTNKFVVKH